MKAHGCTCRHEGHILTTSTENKALPDHLCWNRNERVFQEQICVCEAVIVLWCLVMLSIFHPFIPRWKAKKCNFTACAGSLSIEMTQHFRAGRRWIIKLFIETPNSKKGEPLSKMLITQMNDLQNLKLNKVKQKKTVKSQNCYTMFSSIHFVRAEDKFAGKTSITSQLITRSVYFTRDLFAFSGSNTALMFINFGPIQYSLCKLKPSSYSP